MRRSTQYLVFLFIAVNLNSCFEYREVAPECTITDSDERPSKSTLNKQEALIGKWATVTSATDMTELYPRTYEEFLPDSVYVYYSYAKYDTGTYWFNGTTLCISRSGTMSFQFDFLDYNRLQRDNVYTTVPIQYSKRIKCVYLK